LAVWLFCRPYLGIRHDARIYVGRALADLHPASLGGQIAFDHDGQSAFSVFPVLMRAAVSWLGPGPAAIVLTAAGLGLWIAAAAWLFSRYARGAVLWACLACLAGLSLDYGGYSVFGAAEPFVTPRLFSEAAGLAALAALAGGRKAGFFAGVAVSAILHPIMALPVAGIGFVMLVAEDSRWLGLIGAGAVAVGAGVALKLPLIGRATESFDPAWLGVIVERSPYLFPRYWLALDWSLLALQAGMVTIGAFVAERRLRLLLLAAMATTAAGVALTAIWPSVLVVQLQPWRAQWLLAVLAAGMLPVTASGLAVRGRGCGALIPLLLLAWLTSDSPVGVAVCAGILALLLAARAQPLPAILTPALWIVWAIAAAGVALVAVRTHLALFAGLPASEAWSLDALAGIGLQSILLPALAVAVVVASGDLRTRGAWALALAAALAGVAAFAPMWDARSAVVRAREAGKGAAALRGIVSRGSVLWISGDGASWLWTGRPEWWNQIQGAGVVFDRALALEWRRRADAVSAAGVVRQPIWRATRPEGPRAAWLTTGRALVNLCRTRNGPDWVVAPIGRVDGGLAPDAVPPFLSVWRAPATEYRFHESDRSWVAIRDYGVMSCARIEAWPGGR
jgi:hypothetical protein